MVIQELNDRKGKNYEAFRLKELIKYDERHNPDKEGIYTIFPSYQEKEKFEKKTQEKYLKIKKR